MSLGDLNVATRGRLRRHAWLLTMWCVALGFVTSWILYHVFGLRQPAARYGIGAIVMYALGLVCGARVWLVLFAQSVRREPAVLGRAGSEDAAALAAQARARERRGERAGS